MIDENNILQAIQAHFQANSEHVLKIIASNYSLNWLKTESQVAINWSKNNCIPLGAHVHISAISLDSNQGNQGKQADIVVLDKMKKILAKIEFELYDPNNPEKNEDSIKELKRKIDHHIQHRSNIESKYAIIGVLFAIWKVKLPSENTLDQEATFYRDLNQKLSKYFSGEKFKSHTTFQAETILSSNVVDWGFEKWETSLLASTVSCPPLTETRRQQTNLTWIDLLADEEPLKHEKIEITAADIELKNAQKVQQNMLKDAPSVHGFQFSTRYESCDEISGDFYEFIKLPDDKIGFAQGDVSGHGVASSLFAAVLACLVMSMAKKVLSMNARKGHSPAEVLASVNEELMQDLNGKTFISMAYGILDIQKRQIVWARAGHNPSIFFNVHTKEMMSLKPPGMVAGVRDSFLFKNSLREEVLQLNSGDIFLMYTDGLVETNNRQGEPYRQERLEEVVKIHGNQNLESLLDRIMDSARGYRGGASIADDITLLALKVD